MTLYYLDPIDPQQHWEAGRTAQIGFADHGNRQDMTAILSQRRASVFDLYRAPSILLSDIFAFPSFLRVMDFATYEIVENQIKKRVSQIIDPLEASPIIVYGAPDGALIKHISVIDGSGTHPHLISAYYLQVTRGF